MPAVQCQNCGLIVQVPDGGRRLCGCGTWLSADEVAVVVEAEDADLAERWPHDDGDLAAIERLNDGYRRIRKELSKAVVGQQRIFKFLHGPLFANVILADEVNRTPPKTQAALLEAMQERQVTVGGTRHGLPDPFFVLATQNPIEQEGTYPLPEAQQDRFMFHIL